MLSRGFARSPRVGRRRRRRRGTLAADIRALPKLLLSFPLVRPRETMSRRCRAGRTSSKETGLGRARANAFRTCHYRAGICQRRRPAERGVKEAAGDRQGKNDGRELGVVVREEACEGAHGFLLWKRRRWGEMNEEKEEEEKKRVKSEESSKKASFFFSFFFFFSVRPCYSRASFAA